MKPNQQKTKTQRIPIKLLNKITKIGSGDFRAGLHRMEEIYDLVNKDPSIILLRELDQFSNLIHAFSSENHYGHFVDSGMPVVLRKFIQTGRIDVDFLKHVREEKALETFSGDKDKDDDTK